MLLIGLFWPGCLLVLPAVGRAVDRAWGGSNVNVNVNVKKGVVGAFVAGWRRLNVVRGVASGREVELFLLAWIVPAWIVFELSPAKLPHYTMPLLPALALLVARFALAAQARLVVGNTAGVWGWFLVGAGLPVAAAAGVWVSDLAPEGRVGALVFVIGLIGIPVWGGMLVVVQMIRGHQWASAMAGAACAGGFALAMTLHVVVPFLSRVEQPRLLTGNLTERLFMQVREVDPAGWSKRPIASVWQEDSVVFQSRGRVEKIGKGEQAAWLSANPAGILIGTRDADAVGRNAREYGPEKSQVGFAVLSPVRMANGELTPPSPRLSRTVEPGKDVRP
ncbi:MAG: hypothetical protein QM783_05150 [Phycisphaerales bacterium]